MPLRVGGGLAAFIMTKSTWKQRQSCTSKHARAFQDQTNASPLKKLYEVTRCVQCTLPASPLLNATAALELWHTQRAILRQRRPGPAIPSFSLCTLSKDTRGKFKMSLVRFFAAFQSKRHCPRGMASILAIAMYAMSAHFFIRGQAPTESAPHPYERS